MADVVQGAQAAGSGGIWVKLALCGAEGASVLPQLIAAVAASHTMPSYTHLRRAQPILVAHFFLAHAAAFRRDCQRFEQVLDEADEMPLGSGAIAGTTCAVDTPAEVAARLARWKGAVDEVVLRSVTPNDTAEETLALVRAAKPA